MNYNHKTRNVLFYNHINKTNTILPSKSLSHQYPYPSETLKR